MATLNWTKRVNGGANNPYDGPDATLENPVSIAGGYAFLYKQSTGFTGTLKLFGTFQIGANDQPVGGVITGITFVTENGTSVYKGFSIPTATMLPNLYANTYEAIWTKGFSGADNLTGSQYNDSLWGYAGNDTVLAGDGDDWLVGGKGSDVLNGGAGLDGVTYFNATAGVHIDLLHRSQQGGSEGSDTLISIEKVAGSRFDDGLQGSDGADTLIGLQGNDFIYARNGNDWLKGGKGNDHLDGGFGTDGVSYSDADGAVRVSLLIKYVGQKTGSDGTDDLTSIEKLEGSAFGDRLTGSEYDNSLWGLNGQDTLIGGAGNDWLSGGGGNDRLSGGAGKDGVSYAEAKGGVQVSLMIQNKAQKTGSAGSDTLSGIERLEGSLFNDKLVGSGLGNTVFGLDGKDYIDGKSGNDTLSGGIGNDILRGSGGQDFFAFFADETGHDRIRDFNVFGEEQILLQAGIFSSETEAYQMTTDTEFGAKLSWLGGSVLLENVSKNDLTEGDFLIFT